MSDETAITALIRRWAAAVHDGDLPAVLADHAADIVMFDVPPPDDGVRGIDAYRETWPPFFEWQRSGASFEILDLTVTAGADVAFAHARSSAGPRTSSAATRSAACGSPSGCGRTMGAGW